MKTSSRSYQGHAYNAIDAQITTELRQRQSATRVAAASLAKRRGDEGPEAQILALVEWCKILVADNKIAAAKRVRATVHRLNAALDAQEAK